MTNEQPVLLKKLYVILHRSLVEARSLALVKNCPQIYDLADTFEFLPTLMTRWDPNHLTIVRTSLERYQSKYPGTAYDYLSILDMDDRAFQDVFQG